MEDKTKTTEPKTWTLRATCTHCGNDFTYVRRHSLIGVPRSVCDSCKSVRKHPLIVDSIVSGPGGR